MADQKPKTDAEADGHVHGPDCAHGHHHEPVVTYKRLGAKVGRNDSCPCGSGKKYKKCCLYRG
ncbi:MAG: hypothetical protein RLZ98_2357 [Pseudomonadota bacterium]|jgi:uncharacterized protein YecA (UPF0149 family)